MYALLGGYAFAKLLRHKLHIHTQKSLQKRVSPLWSISVALQGVMWEHQMPHKIMLGSRSQTARIVLPQYDVECIQPGRKVGMCVCSWTTILRRGWSTSS